MMLSYGSLLLLLLIATSLSTPTNFLAAAECSGPRTPGELRAALWAGESTGYDRFTRPGNANATEASGNTPPDVARVQLHVLSLSDLDQKRNQFQLNVWFRRRWNDYRLRHLSNAQGGCFTNRQGFSESILNEIWVPDIFVENQIKISSTVAGSVWLYPNGDVVHVNQLLITLACDMDFRDFPNDQQNCGLKVGTFLEDAQQVVLGFWENLDPITIAEKEAGDSAHIPQGGTNEWEIVGVTARDDQGLGHGATQAESSVEVVLQLHRKSDYYTDFVILPAFMFVTIGWTSFFISRTVAPARVTMSIVCFLANTNFLTSQLGQLPRLGNDVWLLRFLTVSTIFTFYSVVEYVLCNHLLRIEGRVTGAIKRAQELKAKQIRKKRRSSMLSVPSGRAESALGKDPPGVPGLEALDDDDDDETSRITKEDIRATGFTHKLDMLILNKKGEMYFKDQHIDIFSRYAYPLSYAMACLLLWLR